jgi:hypothetical protein
MFIPFFKKKLFLKKKLKKLGVCDERRVGLRWEGEEDECVGWGGESLFVAALP